MGAFAGLLCAYRSVKESCEKMSVDMTFSFLNKEYEDDQEKVVDVVNDHNEKVEDAEVEKKEEYNPSENYRDQYYQGTEKDDAFDDIRSDEEEGDEDDEEEEDRDGEGSEEERSEEDVSDESRSEDVSEESRSEEDETDALQFGKRAFSDIYSPVGELDQDKSEEPIMKKQKFEISEILSSAV